MIEPNILAFQNGALLAALAEPPTEGWTITGLAEHLERDDSNLGKTLRRLRDEGLLLDPPLSGLTDEGRAQLAAFQRARHGGERRKAKGRWDIDQIRPNPANRKITAADVEGMADAIVGAGGVLLPLVLSPPDANGVRTIWAGERRWRATRLLAERRELPEEMTAGLPFVEREATPGEAALIAVIENTARKDLTPWEDARFLKQAADGLGITNASELARRIGRARDGDRGGLRDVQDKLKIANLATAEQIADYEAKGSWDDFRDQVLKRGAYSEKTPATQPKLAPSPEPSRPARETFANPDYVTDHPWKSIETVETDQFDRQWVIIKVYRRGSDAAFHATVRTPNGSEGSFCAQPAGSRDEAVNAAVKRARTLLGSPLPWLSQWLDQRAGPFVVNGVDYGNATRAQEARYAAGILKRPAANYGSAPRSEPTEAIDDAALAGSDASGSEAVPAGDDAPGEPAHIPLGQVLKDMAEEAKEQKRNGLRATLEVLLDRVEPVLALLNGDRTEDGFVQIESDDAEWFAKEIEEATRWAEDALAVTGAFDPLPGEDVVRSGPTSPAVPIRKSITPDHIVCLEDGRKFKSLKRHLRTKYDLSPDEYRARWGLAKDYPMVAPNYAKAREDLARQMGLRS